VETIEAATASNDLIVVSLHMGLEYVSVPSAMQIALAEACLNAGAHVVHYHHAHCLSGAATNGRGLVLFGTGNYVFPGAATKPVASARCTAAWRVRFDRRTRKVVALGAHPAIIDGAGLPRALEGQAQDGEIERLNALSRIMLGGAGRQFSRLKDLLNPGFLRFNARNYWFLLRRRGPLHVLRSLGAGIGAQLFGRQG
jgi:hypothetical protein